MALVQPIIPTRNDKRETITALLNDDDRVIRELQRIVQENADEISKLRADLFNARSLPEQANGETKPSKPTPSVKLELDRNTITNEYRVWVALRGLSKLDAVSSGIRGEVRGRFDFVSRPGVRAFLLNLSSDAEQMNLSV